LAIVADDQDGARNVALMNGLLDNRVYRRQRDGMGGGSRPNLR
jgi:hypothetical protein